MFQREMNGPANWPRWMGVCLRHRSQAASRKASKLPAQNKSLLIPYGPVIATGTLLALTIASGR